MQSTGGMPSASPERQHKMQRQNGTALDEYSLNVAKQIIRQQ